MNFKKFEGPQIFLFTLAAVVMLFVGSVMGYVLGVQLNQRPAVSIPAEQTDLPPDQIIDPSKAFVYEPSMEAEMLPDGGSIMWSKMVEIPSLQLLTNEEKAPGIEYIGYRDRGATYYRVGKLKDRDDNNGWLVYIISSPDEMDMQRKYFFAQYSGKTILLAKYSSVLEKSKLPFDYDGLLREKIIVDNEFTIPSLEFPKTVQGPKPRQIAQFLSRYDMVDVSPSSLEPFMKFDCGQGYAPTGAKGQSIYFPTKGPFFAVYRYGLDFSADPGKIIWNDGTKNKYKYLAHAMTGCGSSISMQEAIPYFVSSTEYIVPVGKNSLGDILYSYKSTDDAKLKQYFEDFKMYSQESEIKDSYDTFLKMHPVIFWYNQFGVLVTLIAEPVYPPVECGKPVIYLYPEKTTSVNVKLELAGGMSKSEPEYGQGWQVVAKPNGELTNSTDGKIYPYLFWEGKGGTYETPERGFVVKQVEVSKFLDDKLTAFGLNQKEISDFMEFWLPRMQAEPYYFITFLGTKQMDALAPLTIVPKPDTTIRVLMDFKPLDAPIVVKGFNIPTPVRHGFTAVEWGGVLR